MTTSTLNAVAIDVVGQYGMASKLLVEAYRVGTQRAVAQISDTVAKTPALPMIDGSIRDSFLAAHAQLTGFFVGGVTRATEQADLAIDRMTDVTTQGIKRLAGAGERVEAMVGAPVVETMTKINMPAAQLSLQIAGQVVEGSKRLVQQVAGDNVVEATVAAAAEPKTRAKRAA